MGSLAWMTNWTVSELKVANGFPKWIQVAEFNGWDGRLVTDCGNANRGNLAIGIPGYWLFSGRLCIYALHAYSVVYANSAIVVNLSRKCCGVELAQLEK